MTPRDNPDGQDDVDAIFGEIVADLRAEGLGKQGIRRERERQADAEAHEDPPAVDAGPPPVNAREDWRSANVGWDDTMLSDSPIDDSDDEHFVPPEPPPLPKLSSNMVVVLLFFGTGLVLLIAPGLIGLSSNVGVPLGILSLAAGLGFLVLHAPTDPRPPGSDPDTGAQV